VEWAVVTANQWLRAGVTRWPHSDVALERQRWEGAEEVRGRRGLMARRARLRAIMSLTRRARACVLGLGLWRGRGVLVVCWAKERGEVWVGLGQGKGEGWW
jgi:hypothetical protein